MGYVVGKEEYFVAFRKQNGLKPLEKRAWLSSPTMHGPELQYMTEAFESNWMSTVGENIGVVESLITQRIGCGYAVALCSGTAALHLAVKLAGVKRGNRVFVSDMTFSATANAVMYEGGEPVFIDADRDTWNMDPAALERAFELYPAVKVVVIANLYGTPGKMTELCEIAHRHGAVVIEDAAESLGATYEGRQTGTFGDIAAISFNGNKIITGSCGGALLTNSKEAAHRVRKWSTQAREDAAWYQHEELGYNYRMSNVVAGVVRGQLPYLEEHMAQKRAIYERYREGLRGLPVTMNPYEAAKAEPNFWLSCLLIDEKAMCPQERGDLEARYEGQSGKSCPTEIIEALARYNAEARPIWKPMHLQPVFRDKAFISAGPGEDVGADIFRRGLCLPSDNKLTADRQERIMEIVRACFA